MSIVFVAEKLDIAGGTGEVQTAQHTRSAARTYAGEEAEEGAGQRHRPCRYLRLVLHASRGPP